MYNDFYVGGTWCPAANASRSAEVKITCEKDALFVITEIKEPKICFYAIEIGSYLLCEEELSKETTLGYGQ
jgi:hypothetical protein